MTETTLHSARVELEIPINADRETVWKGLTEEIGEWWPQEFFITEKSRFTLEPRLGGYMFEDAGDGTGAIWFQVRGIIPFQRLYLEGHIAPPYGGPATSLVTITLEEKEGGTLFKLSDSLFGVIPPDRTSSMDEGWKQIFEQGLKKYLESRGE